ncbi:hypothetical protein K501DRAFT_211192 [Backusella circina FSU 941]|nr:hypothetical protein K501DRAFT_211192 [Backusella circina FSU 941]
MSSLIKGLVRLAPTLPRYSPSFTVTKRFATTVVTPADDILQYREKPASLSYFTGNYKYNDLLIELDALYKRFEQWKPTQDNVKLPSDYLSVQQEEAAATYSWKLRDKMSELLSIPLTTSQWRKITTQLTQLASLPKPLPASVVAVLEPYQRFDVSQGQQVKARTLDELGRAYAVGRRKESSARCYLVEGEGKILVNGTELDDYFQRPVDRNAVTLPLDVTETKDKYNAWVLVKGGGSTGQAEAIKLGIGKALLIHDSELKPTLRKAGCVTRDPRVVERKKEGQRKARAKYTWVKR